MSKFIRQQLNIQNKSEYQVYQDGLNQYKRRKLNQLHSSQWDPLSSRLASPLSDSKYFVSPDEKPKLRANEAYPQRVESKSLAKKDGKNIYSFGQQLKQKFDFQNPSEKTNEALQQQIKEMRERLVLLNNTINNKINKYQLHEFKPKGLIQVNEPQKQSQLLASQIQTNTKILQAFEKQIKQIKERDKLLQQNDYLIELEQSANEVMARIREKKKQKHNGKVVVEKLDGRLLEMKEAALQDQFKMVKVVKHNTLYFYKRIKDNDKILEELDRRYKQLHQKDQKLTQELNKYTTLAQQKNMPVKTNPNYLQKIRAQNQLSKIVQQHRKKVEVVKKSKEAECLKISLEVDKIKKQLLSTQAKLQEYKLRDKQVTAITENAMEKSKLEGKILNKVSQRYAEGVGLKLIRNIVKQSAQHEQEQVPSINEKQKSLDTSIQSPSQYRTLSLKPGLKLSRFKKQHEANSKTIQFESSDRKQYRVKPSLHLKKRTEELKKITENIKQKTKNQN